MGASQVPFAARDLPIKSRSLTSPTIAPPRFTATAPIFLCAITLAASRQGVEASRLTTSRTTFLWIVAIGVLLGASRPDRAAFLGRNAGDSRARRQAVLPRNRNEYRRDGSTVTSHGTPNAREGRAPVSTPSPPPAATTLPLARRSACETNRGISSRWCVTSTMVGA